MAGVDVHGDGGQRGESRDAERGEPDARDLPGDDQRGAGDDERDRAPDQCVPDRRVEQRGQR